MKKLSGLMKSVVSMLAVILLVGNMSAVAYAQAVVQDLNQVIHVKEATQIYTGPGEEYDVVEAVDVGTAIFVLSLTDNGWYQIYYSYEVYYIKSEWLEEPAETNETEDRNTEELVQSLIDAEEAAIAQALEQAQAEATLQVIETSAQAEKSLDTGLIVIISLTIIFIIGLVVVSISGKKKVDD